MVSMATRERCEFCFSLAEKGAAKRNGAAAGRSLTPDVLREKKCAKSVPKHKAARCKCNPDHGYILFSTTTPTGVDCRATCIREKYFRMSTYKNIFLQIKHLSIV